MKSFTRSEVQKVLNRYDGDYDLGPYCPVTWREGNLAVAVLELSDEVETLKAQVRALLDAVPSAKVESTHEN